MTLQLQAGLHVRLEGIYRRILHSKSESGTISCKPPGELEQVVALNLKKPSPHYSRFSSQTAFEPKLKWNEMGILCVAVCTIPPVFALFAHVTNCTLMRMCACGSMYASMQEANTFPSLAQKFFWKSADFSQNEGHRLIMVS